MKSASITILSSLVLLPLGFVGALAQEDPAPRNVQFLNPLQATTISDVKAFAQRPLFAPTRRRAVVEEAVTSMEAEELGEPSAELILLGVTSGPEGSIARIARADGTERNSLRKGEVIDGWTVESVGPSSVTIARDGRSIDLTIFKGAGVQAEVDETEATSTGPGIVFGSEDPAEDADQSPAVRVVDPN